MASKRIKGITIEIGAETKQLTAAIKDAEKQIGDAAYKMRDINKLLKADPKNVELLTQKQKAFTEAIEGTKEKLKQEKQALEQLKNGPQTEETIRQQEALGREIAETEQKLESLEKEYKEFGTVATQQSKLAGEHMQNIGKNIEDAGRGIQDAGRGLTTYVTAPIVAAGTAAFMNYAEVDKIMTLTNKTMGNTEEQAKSLNQAMMDAASNSTFGMTDAANATLNFARAGLSAEEAAAALAPAMNLAAGEGGNLDTVSAGLVGTINGFGDPFSEATHYADVFAVACNKSELDVDSLANSMGVAAPVFRSAGKEVEDAALYLGVMANNNIEASVAANALKTGLMRLSDAPKKAQEAMEKYNIAITDVWGPDGSMKDAVSIQKNLHDSFARLTEQEQLAAASAIFGKNQGAAWLALINAAPSEVDELAKSLSNVSGTTEEMANAMMAGTGGSIERLKSSIDVLGYSFGELTANYIQPLIDKLQEIVDKLQAMDPETKDAIIKMAGVAAAVGPVLMVIGSLVVGIGKLIWAVGKIKAAFAGLSGASAVSAELAAADGAAAGLGASLMGLLGPILAVAAAIAVWVHNWDEIKEAGQLFVERTLEHFEAIKAAAIEVHEAIKAYVAAKWEEIKNTATTAMEALKIALGLIWDFIKGIFTEKIEFIKGVVDGGFGFIVETIKGKLEAAREAVQWIIDNIKGIMEGVANIAKTWGEHLIDNFINGIKSKASFVTTAVSGLANTVREYLHFSEPDVGPLADFNTWMPDMMSQMAEQINAGVPGVRSAMQNVTGAMRGEMAPDYSGQLAGINQSVQSLAAAGGGNITVPVYIGQQKFAQAVVDANQVNRFRNGGR